MASFGPGDTVAVSRSNDSGDAGASAGGFSHTVCCASALWKYVLPDATSTYATHGSALLLSHDTATARRPYAAMTPAVTPVTPAVTAAVTLPLAMVAAVVAPPLVWSMAARGCISRGSAERSRQSASPVLAPRRTRAAMGGGQLSLVAGDSGGHVQV